MDAVNEQKDSMEPSFWAAVKVVVVEWFLSSTAHAIPNIFRTGNILLKIIWTVCLLASTSYCIYSMVVSLQQYLEYPTYFTTEVVQEIPAPFPAVTLCNIKTVNKTASISYFQQPQFSPFIVNASAMNSTLQYIMAQQYFARTALNNDITVTAEKKKEVGFQLKDMLMSCMFNYEFCSYTDFAYFYDPLYGNCYTFNGGKNENGTSIATRKVSVGGPLYGLILELFLGNPEVDTIFDYNDGVILSIHNQTQLPFTSDTKMMASVGADTDLILTRKFLSKLEAPYGNCQSDITLSSSFSSPYFDYIVRTSGTLYTQKYCYSLCLQRQIMNKCGCANTFLPVFKNENFSYCFNPTTDAICVYTLVNSFGESQANQDCQAACPFECNSEEFEVSTYRSLYPTKFYQDILAKYSLIKYNNITYDNIPLSVAKVNVYYKNMIYSQTTEQIAITTEAFFSNMGGTLGLYIGISMLSLVEIVELFVNLIVAILSVSKAKQQVKSTISETRFSSPAKSSIILVQEKTIKSKNK